MTRRCLWCVWVVGRLVDGLAVGVEQPLGLRGVGNGGVQGRLWVDLRGLSRLSHRLVVGLLWIVVYYMSEYKYPVASIGVWNLGVGFALLMSGFIMTMRWR